MKKTTDIWSKYENIGYKQHNRIMFGIPSFSVNERSYENFFKNIKVSDKKQFSSCLDLGCGNGLNGQTLFDLELIKGYVGVDNSAGALRGARHVLSKYVLKKEVELFNKSFVDFNSTSQFDLVMSIQSINYMKRLDDFFEVVNGFIITGGNLIVVDVQKSHGYAALLKNKAVRNNIIRKIFQKEPYEDQSGVVYHDYKDIRNKAKEYGFTLKKSQFTGHFIHNIFSPFMYKLAVKEFESDKIRYVAKSIYIFLRSLVELENRLLPFRDRGQIHFSLFQKNEK